MRLHYCALLNSKVLRKKVLFIVTTLNFPVKQKSFLSKASPNLVKSFQMEDPIFNTSIKPYVDPSKINYLNRCAINSASRNSFVIDEAVAKDIVKQILSRIDCNKSLIVEANPGLGLITCNLINSGVTHLRVFGNSAVQQIAINQMLEKHPDKLTIMKKLIDSDSTLSELFDEAELKNQVLVILRVTNSLLYIRYLILTFVKFGFWRSSYEIFLVLNSCVWESLKQVHAMHFKYLYYCIFNNLFNAEKISTYPCSAFLPKNKNDFILVRITSSPNFLGQIDEEDLLHYIYFLSLFAGRENESIISTLEKWSPDCGPYLISKGISVSNVVSDLTYQESITLFNLFKKYEGYNDFKILIDSAFENIVIG